MENFTLIDGESGYWVHLCEDGKAILTDCFPAVTFDNRDNKELKRRFYSALCGRQLKVFEF